MLFYPQVWRMSPSVFVTLHHHDDGALFMWGTRFCLSMQAFFFCVCLTVISVTTPPWTRPSSFGFGKTFTSHCLTRACSLGQVRLSAAYGKAAIKSWKWNFSRRYRFRRDQYQNAGTALLGTYWHCFFFFFFLQDVCPEAVSVSFRWM